MFAKRKAVYRVIAAFVAAIFTVAPLAQVYAATPAVKTSNYVIKDMSGAQSALGQLASAQEIKALVYLKDVYTMREEADAYSNNVASLATGSMVNIIGVDEDAGRNIWFKVRFFESGKTYQGYIERDFLAYSDERLLAWEEKYVTTLKRESAASSIDMTDVEQFPESYKSALYSLKKAHPDWIFVRQNCGLDWNASVAAESEGARSLIDTSGTPASRMDGIYGAGWAYASDGSIAYYMDPRNFLTEVQIFQFELLTYNASYHTEAAVQKIIANSFMSGNIEGTSTPYSSYFMSMASKYNISPILQAARVLSEQGSGGSAMISGTYPGYEGLYNYYNISASGSTTKAIMESGLTYARKKNWTSRMASLEGGASFLANGYVSAGQDTLYLQKWDLIGTPYTHQYMQAVYGAYSNAKSAYNGYSRSGVLNTSPFVFRIPVYENMPAAKQINPGTTDTFAIDIDTVENLPVDQSAVIHPLINGAKNTGYEYTYSSSNSGVATVDSNGVITGVRPGSATITCKAGSLGSLTCAVSVIKADIAVSDVELPEINVTYDPEQSLSDIELPDSFAWVNGDTVPTVENEGYSVLYEPDNSKYNSITLTLAVDVDKAVLTTDDIDIPTDIEAEAGTELLGVALPDNFTWNDTSLVLPMRTGSYTYIASYCPDPDNYEVTDNINIQVQAICSSHVFGEWSEAVNGYKTRTCSICGETESLRVEEQVTNEDCITNGHNMVDGVCTRCGYEEPVVQIHEHEYTLSDNTATCTEDGVKTYTCSCGDSYTEEVKATGHKFVNGECSVCGYKSVPTTGTTPTVRVTPTTGTTPTVRVTPTAGITPTVGTTPTVKTSPSVKVTPTAVVTPTKVVAQITSIVTPTPTAGTTPTAVASPTVRVTPTVGTTPTVRVTPTAGTTPTVRVTPTAVVTPTKVVAQITSIVTPTVIATPTVRITPTPTTPVAQITSIVTPTAATSPTVKASPTAGTTPKITNGTTPKVTNGITPKVTTGTTPTAGTTPQATTEATPTAAATPAGTVTNAAAGNTTNPVPPATNNTANNNTGNANEAGGELNKPTTAETPGDNEGVSTAAEEVKSKATLLSLEGDTHLTGEKLADIAEGTQILQVEMPESGVVWNIDLEGIDTSNLDVDLSVTFNESQIPAAVVDGLDSSDYILMTLGHNGAFGFKATLDVPVGTEHAGKFANLYYFNPDSSEMEFVESVAVSGDGKASFKFEHASEYAITFSDKMLTGPSPFKTYMILIVLVTIMLVGAVVTVSVINVSRRRAENAYLDSEDDDLFAIKKKEKDIDYFD